MIYQARSKQLILMAFLIAFSLLVFNSAEVGATGSGPLHRDGIIEGRVTNQYGAPIPNVSIDVLNRNGHSVTIRYEESVTNAQGYYRLTDIAYDTYRIQFSDRSRRYADAYFGGSVDLSDAHTVTVENNQRVQANVQLAPAGYIQGNVRFDSNSTPQYLSIAALRWDGAEWSRYRTDYHYEASSGTNYFSIGGLPTGQYKLRVVATVQGRQVTSFYPNQSTVEAADVLTIATGQKVWINDVISLPVSTSISGVVTSAETGKPLNRVSVTLYSLNPEIGDWIATDYDYTGSDGYYRFNDLPVDNYKIGYSVNSNSNYADEYNGNQPTLGGAPQLVLEEGQELVYNKTLEIGGTVRGTARLSDGTTFSNYTIAAYRYNGAGAWLKTSTDYVSRYDNTKDYTLNGLPAGHYRFYIEGRTEKRGTFSFWYGSVQELEEAQVVDVKLGETQRLPDATIGGSITVFGTVRDLDWNRLSNAAVDLYRLVNDDYWTHVATVKADENGEYRFDDLAPGGYTLSADAQNSRYLVTYLGGKSRLKDAIGFELEAGGIRSADFYLPRTASISGKLTTLDGSIPASGSVYVRGVNNSFTRYASMNHDGSYQIGGLPAGDYQLELYAYDANYNRIGWEYYDDVATLEEATVLSLTTGQELTGISAEIGNLGIPQPRDQNSISGQVTDGTTPLAGIDVHLYVLTGYRSATWWYELETVRTDGNGNYQFDNLSSNGYRVGFRDSSGTYATQYYRTTNDFNTATTINIQDNVQHVNDVTVLTR